MLKREDVHFAVKLAILPKELGGGGVDPLVFGGTLPAIMMAKLQQLGVTHAEISGGMTVSESNKASDVGRTGVQSVTNAGVGTAFWHVNEQLTVKHSTKSEQKRGTDYRAHIDWKVEIGPMGESEGVGLIKDTVSSAFQGVQKINETIANAALEQAKAKLGESGPPTEEDADKFMEKTDQKDLLDEGGDSGDSGDEPADKTKIDDDDEGDSGDDE